jgi:hypothetical protein
MSGHVACTIAAANYLPFVRVLARSLREHAPGTRLAVLLVADERQRAAAQREGLDIVSPHELNIPALQALLQRYNRKQACAALKPALLRHLLERGCESAVFLDPDILVTADLAPVFTTVAAHALTLTSHVRKPASMFARLRHAPYLLLSGMYNAGFVGVRACEESRRFLAWWEERLRTHCLDARAAGINHDQRWLDHAVGFVGDLHLLRDPGCNVAYWNMQDLEWRSEGSAYLVDGVPLRFFHFSGFDPAVPSRVTRYLPELRAQPEPVARLFRTYADLVRQPSA